MSGCRLNPIWSFFEKLENDRSKALCKICGKTLSLGSVKPKAQSVHGLMSHLRAYHKDEHKLFIKKDRRRVNPIWNFFEKLESDRGKAQCKVCGNILSLGSVLPKAQSISGLKRHLMAYHEDEHEMILDTDREIERAAKRIKQEHAEVDYPEITFEVPNVAESAMQSETISDLLHLWYENGVQDDECTAGGHVDGPEEESTSGASTTDSAHRGLVAPTLRSDSSVHRQLCNQLRDLEDENKKLLQKLVDSQLAFQDVLKHAIDDKQQQTDHLRRSLHIWDATRRGSFVPIVQLQCDAGTDADLTEWLSSIGIDSDVADKLTEEQFTKDLLLNTVSREDLYRLGLRGGACCRIWNEIISHRRRSSAASASTPSASVSATNTDSTPVTSS